MTGTAHPALQSFLAQWSQDEGSGELCLFVQVSIRRLGRGFELRHQSDQDRPPETLRVVPVQNLRALAQTTANGAFRPLRSAPNLASGWRTLVEDELGLASALHQLYPGGLADWYAASQPAPPTTSFREFTRRQSGMYRVVATLSDPQAAQVTRTCCQARFCLKRRLWTVGTEPAEPVEGKGLIPCLEPCAIFLEFARKIVRLEQGPAVESSWTPAELEAALIALQQQLAAEGDKATGREADFEDPTNPRRLAWEHEKLKALIKERSA